MYLSRLFFVASAVVIICSCNKTPQSTTTTIDNSSASQKAIIEQYFQYFNQHDWQKMSALYVESPEMKDPAYGLTTVKMTREEIVKKYTALQQAIPDVRDSIVSMYYANDNVIVEFESMGTSPDGSKFSLPICTIFEIKNGKITKDFTYYDNFDTEK